MNYSEIGFRAINHSFCAVMLKDNLKIAAKDFPGIEEADCLLLYGYIDHQEGVSFEILAAGKKGDIAFDFFDGNDSISAKIRVGTIENDELLYLEDSYLKKRYAEKVNRISDYDADDEIMKTRRMRFLDNSRHPYYPDDIQVLLFRDGLQPEMCWARIFGLGDHWIMATLLNEPNQDFDYHVGDKIAVFVQEKDDGEFVCYTNMNPTRKVTAADLEDGTVLKQVVAEFHNDRTERNFVAVLEILRDSHVWIPCNVIPEIIHNGDEYFLPVFSSVEEMGEYGERFSKVRVHIFEAIALAKNHEKNISGIVLNVFSDPFILEAEIYDIVENMKSGLSK